MFDIDGALKLADEVDGRLKRAEVELTKTFVAIGSLKVDEKTHPFDSLTAPKVDKYAAAMVIADGEGMEHLSDPYQFRIVGQLMFVDNTFYGTKRSRLAVAMPGGAMRSNQEIDAMAAGEIPDNDRDRQRAFYFVGQKQLLAGGPLRADYDFGTGWNRLVAESMLKIQREMGKAALANCELLDALMDQPKISVLPNFSVIDETSAEIIAEKFHGQGIRLLDADPGKRVSLKGICTRVTEGVLIARGQVGQVVENAAKNELQARMRIFSLGELVRVLEDGCTQVGLSSYRKRFPADGHEGPRNPSLAFQLRRFVSWWGEKVLERDTYKEGSRMDPFLSATAGLSAAESEATTSPSAPAAPK